ncbi:surfeit locus protein 6 [Anolis carolinensis]|uniref:surfeit locus protein 6 n=1 Tax=Anolis carolinensis TaxID=28377 RepID=UPI002F2B499E
MSGVVRQDCYLQGLARKICARDTTAGGRRGGAGPPAKKRRKKRRAEKAEGKRVSPSAGKGASAGKRQPAVKKDRAAPMEGKENGLPGPQEAPGSFSAMGLLRQRLRDKIQEASGQGGSTELSPAVLEKRQRRKYERERKKRRRKELRAKAKAAEGAAEKEAEATEGALGQDGERAAAATTAAATTAGPIVFNKVTVCEEGERRERRKAGKGGLTPLTGKNYRQLLQRLEARQSRVEALKEAGDGKAQALEARMRWSSALHRAQGMHVRDDAERLQAALKAKRKREAQRQRKWGRRTEQVAQRMQQRQDKRRRNLQRRKQGKAEQRKARARKKGRVLPGDLEKAAGARGLG